MEQNVTTIEQLKEYQKGELVQLPDFGENMPFYARLKRPSMLALIKSGKIPNTLITTANELFNGKGISEKKEGSMVDAIEIFDTICEATFLEPSYAELKAAGIELTDEQMTAVFAYTQRGVNALNSFRKKSANNGNSINVKNVPVQAVGAIEP